MKKTISTLLVTCVMVIKLNYYIYLPPKTSSHVKGYDVQTKWVYSLIEDDDLLEKYNTIWDKVSADIKKNLITSLSTIKNI